MANLDPALLGALRRAATDAAGDGIEFYVTSGWRSPAYQEQLLREAVSKYGSEAEAARWVATPDTSAHVSGDAVDIGPPMPRRGCPGTAPSTGCARSTATNPGTTNCAPTAVDHGCPRQVRRPHARSEDAAVTSTSSSLSSRGSYSSISSSRRWHARVAVHAEASQHPQRTRAGPLRNRIQLGPRPELPCGRDEGQPIHPCRDRDPCPHLPGRARRSGLGSPRRSASSSASRSVRTTAHSSASATER